MASENKNLIKAGLASAAIHGLVVALGCLNIFEPQINNDMFLNIELAGAAEMQQALDDYNDNHQIIEDPQTKSEVTPPKETPPQESPQQETQPKEIQPKETPQEESLPEQPPKKPEIEPKPEKIPEEQLVKGPSIVEPQPEPEPEPELEPEPEPEIEDQSLESENSLPAELQKLKDEEIQRLEKEKLERKKLEQIEKEKQEQLRKEEKRRRKKERQEKLREKKRKKKREAARRRKKRLEAIKRIEKKNKEKKNRLDKIADAVKKNEEEKQKKKNNAFAQMLKKEKKNLGQPSYKPSYSRPNGNGMGNGNGLGSYGDGMGFTDSDAAIISSQIIPHWVVAGGVKNAETLIIRIRIKVKDNGEVPASSVEILDKARYNSDRIFKSAADSAKRAILQASPLKIPAEKMHLFRDFEFSFNTDKALGVKK